MAELTVPQIDFSTIGNLPQIYKQGQADNLRQQTLANLGQGGTADAQALLKSGDMSLAQLGITLANHQDQLKQQEISNARQAVQDKLTQQHWGAEYALRKNADARAADKTPSGFIADPNNSNALIPQANGPADPTYVEKLAAAKLRAAGGAIPDNFEVNPDFGKVDGAPRLRPISGGPKDPSTIAAEAEAKQGGGMGEGAVEILARRLNSGDTAALQNVGRGNQGSKNLERIQNRAAEILQKEEGLSVSDAAKHVSTNIQSFKASQVGQSAEARTGAVREANLNLILKATEAAIPAALEQSDKVSRTGFVPLNKIVQGGQVMTSDPELKKFAMANLQLAEHWARAMNPTGVMRESDRDKALAILSTADSNSTYHAVVNQLHTQITRERDAVRGSIPESPQFKGGSSAPPAAAPASGSYVWHPDTGLKPAP